ncbi:type II toxin-antitoxin system HicA family toxin [Rhizobium metallidurans]|uniref:Putative RNA binding protein YcfA (HicA-like mRNA interferase family) n=1 Tax=Rhizobium metallidurans TaxID=1265931 RepID=A0A7W6CUE8_9HYPH|nr:type II toxin-antitoxin system HicA family toxin [Rhizobium metallidurans]MBB3966404.1 putative RNA binding protein YcfA (HicA-like mRNA interferase family) [Rhizobium metallidurans]
MAEGYYKIVCEIISALGYVYLKNAKGSHEKWQSPDTKKMLLVPRNLQSRHTANAILKDAGYKGKL